MKPLTVLVLFISLSIGGCFSDSDLFLCDKMPETDSRCPPDKTLCVDDLESGPPCNLPNSDNCSKYVFCLNQTSYDCSCPTGFFFDMDRYVCDIYPNKCSTTTTESTEQPTPTTESTSTSTTEASTSSNAESTSKSSTEASTSSNTESTSTSTTEASTSSNAESTSKSSTEASTSSNAESTSTSTTEASTSSNAESTSESTTEASTSSNAESTSESTTEASTSSNAESTSESTTEASTTSTTPNGLCTPHDGAAFNIPCGQDCTQFCICYDDGRSEQHQCPVGHVYNADAHKCVYGTCEDP